MHATSPILSLFAWNSFSWMRLVLKVEYSRKLRPSRARRFKYALQEKHNNHCENNNNHNEDGGKITVLVEVLGT